jgi:hypothetical protein
MGGAVTYLTGQTVCPHAFCVHASTGADSPVHRIKRRTTARYDACGAVFRAVTIMRTRRSRAPSSAASCSRHCANQGLEHRSKTVQVSLKLPSASPGFTGITRFSGAATHGFTEGTQHIVDACELVADFSSALTVGFARGCRGSSSLKT